MKPSKEEILAFYSQYVENLKELKNGQYARGRCPFPDHEDKHPSFFISLQTGSWWCFGCKRKGRMEDFEKVLSGEKEAKPFEAKVKKEEKAEKEKADRVEKKEAKKEVPVLDETKAEAVYEYYSAGGTLLYKKLRFPGKRFVFRRPIYDSKMQHVLEWVDNLEGIEPVLYNLPALALTKDDTVFVVEGEKDVETLKQLGLVAVTSPFGCSKWVDSCNEYFQGKKVIIIPDNDEPGKKFAKQVALSLWDYAEKIKIVELPVAEKEDVTDFLFYYVAPKMPEGLSVEEQKKFYLHELKKVIAKAKWIETKLELYDAEMFFDEKKKFQHGKLAYEIMQHYRFITINDSEDCYCYSGGAYTEDGECKIKAICEMILKDEATNHRVNEVVGHIKRSTYVHRRDLDKYRDLICLENGVYNLETGEFLPHSPDYLITVKIPVFYNPEAKCPRIEQFLWEVLEDEKAFLTIQELFGYLLYRRYNIHKAFMFVGSGSNGKSSLINLMKAFIGKKNYACKSLQELEENRFARAELFGKLANFYADLPATALKSTGIFKMLTGEDPIGAERKFKDGFVFDNYAKLIFSCNQIPPAFDETYAFYRRWVIINFPNVFEGDRADKHLLKKLTTKEELSGLFNFAIEGLRRLLEQGDFTLRMSVEETKELYQRMSDPVASFAMDKLEADTAGYVERDKLYQAYVEYCDKLGYPKVMRDTFFKKLQKYFRVSTEKVGGKWVCRGIKLIE